MSARDVIRDGIIKETGVTLATVRADAAIEALTAAGYRILAPGALDGFTREQAAKVADYGVQRAFRDFNDRKKAEGAQDMAEEVAAAIRAMGEKM